MLAAFEEIGSARTESRGTGSSNPVPSTGESAANQTSSMRIPKRKLLGYLPRLFDAVVPKAIKLSSYMPVAFTLVEVGRISQGLTIASRYARSLTDDRFHLAAKNM
jgi:hypothetical protein